MYVYSESLQGYYISYLSCIQSCISFIMYRAAYTLYRPIYNAACINISAWRIQNFWRGGASLDKAGALQIGGGQMAQPSVDGNKKNGLPV